MYATDTEKLLVGDGKGGWIEVANVVVGPDDGMLYTKPSNGTRFIPLGISTGRPRPPKPPTMRDHLRNLSFLFWLCGFSVILTVVCSFLAWPLLLFTIFLPGHFSIMKREWEEAGERVRR